MQIHLNTDLKPYHTFAISQHCEVLVEVNSIENLIKVYTSKEWQDFPKLMLGKGSNVLFTEFYAGVVVINRLTGLDVHQDDDSIYLHVMGGEDWPNLVETCVSHGWNGLENLALIPGCAGSAPVQNIGAYGVEFKDVCQYVEYLDLNTMTVKRLEQQECEFGYRDSVFKHRLYGQAIVTGIGLKLNKAWQATLGYGALQALNETCSAKEIFDMVCETRQDKLPDPDSIGNAGSFFKNPVISQSQYQNLKQLFPNIIAYPFGSEMKVAAGWLIDQCGFKGQSVGGAQVHPQQALVLTNTGNATAQDVIMLASNIVSEVKNRYQIELEHEVRFMGRVQETYLQDIVGQAL
jgi:UDP-N-acetylmuramate dehydrogenase